MFFHPFKTDVRNIVPDVASCCKNEMRRGRPVKIYRYSKKGGHARYRSICCGKRRARSFIAAGMVLACTRTVTTEESMKFQNILRGSILGLALLAAGQITAYGQDDYRQRESDRRSRQQQWDSDQRSRRQQIQSDSRSRRQQSWSDRNSRRQQYYSDRNSRRQQYYSDRNWRRWQYFNNRRTRWQQRRSDRNSRRYRTRSYWNYR